MSRSVLQRARRLLRATLAFALASVPAFAAAPASLEERVAALEQQLSRLAAENRELKQMLGTPPATRAIAAAGRAEQLALGGFVHVHGEAGDTPDSRFTGANDRVFLRRARVNLRGQLRPDWSFRLESDFGANSLAPTAGYRAQLTDAFVEWNAHPGAQLRFGQFKTPFGWEQILSDTRNPFVERSLPNDRLTTGRQIGVGLSGAALDQRLEYSAGVFNGNGVNNSNNDNDDFLSAGRVALRGWSGHVGGQAASWTVATNAFTSRDSGAFTGDRQGLGLDTQFTAGPATLRAEWLRNKNTPRTGPAVTADGWYVAALLDLGPAWQLAARYETFDPNTRTAGNETDLLVLGLNHRLVGNDVVLGVNYVAGGAQPGGSDDRLLTRLQLVF